MLTPLAKVLWIDSIIEPADSILHEEIARTVADLLHSGDYAEALSYFAIGNPAYQFFLGVFYTLTGAPEFVTCAVNSFLAYWGVLALLEIYCLISKCRTAPHQMVYFYMLLPSALVWTSANLKEGPVFWGISMLLYRLAWDRRTAGRLRRGFPLLGFAVVAVLRPHIALLWCLAIFGIGVLRTRSMGAAVVALTGLIVGCVLVQQLRPELIASVSSDGVNDSLDSRYETLTSSEKYASRHFTAVSPTPVLTGLSLIMFRPWPTEVLSLAELFAGLEVWCLASFGAYNWCRTRHRLRCLLDWDMVAMLLVLVLFGFFFTYMYNMGLVVRQRIMVFPALLYVYAKPLLDSKSKVVNLRIPLGRRFAGSGYHRQPRSSSRYAPRRLGDVFISRP
ncbi:hypothetical protein [Bythopirellula goksoeyrii]|nr:hypothetical protein [Bythopirellula goksoeyrii]